MFGKNQEKRFELLHSENVKIGGFKDSSLYIYRDTQTGVQYLFADQGTSGGLTPLLDKNGKPIVDDVTK